FLQAPVYGRSALQSPIADWLFTRILDPVGNSIERFGIVFPAFLEYEVVKSTSKAVPAERLIAALAIELCHGRKHSLARDGFLGPVSRWLIDHRIGRGHFPTLRSDPGRAVGGPLEEPELDQVVARPIDALHEGVVARRLALCLLFLVDGEQWHYPLDELRRSEVVGTVVRLENRPHQLWDARQRHPPLKLPDSRETV